ncbi:CAP domain-containing protein [Aquipuribacter nitratireducens]|uniref:CAP domain-containing protein n=1 Tax=Aquipuribacter nitratireducens TaxID=650104 RepID=A0ABW0GMY8_9MICO
METPETPLSVPVLDRRSVLRGASVLGAAGAAGAALTLTAAPASASLTSMYSHVATSRRSAGKRQLSRGTALQRVAQAWAVELARTGQLRHNPRYASLIPRGWLRAGENVGYVSGSSPEARLHRMWMDSRGHRANILGAYTHVGIGRAFDSRGRLWGVQVFAAYPR